MTSRTVQFGISKNGRDLGSDLDQDPRDDDVSDRDAIDFAPFQLDKKLLQARAAGSCARPGVNARMRKGHMKVMARLGDSGKCCLCEPSAPRGRFGMISAKRLPALATLF